jgi:hypothetical protein
MPKPATNASRRNIYIPDVLSDIGGRLAKSRGISFSELVRTALAVYIRDELTREKALNTPSRKS